ncbi:MAG: glycosyltransferase [Candidatus Omnitrophica bacterium]|nr:glycosyltransferase [Candidatus Omnitrophota bacterium]
MIDLSIVFGTYNRPTLIDKCSESVKKSCDSLDHEIIIVNGDHGDSPSWSFKNWMSDGTTTMIYRELNGCVDAYNIGFSRARGKYVAFLNDDITVENNAIVQAVELLDANPKVGMVAIPYENPGQKRQVAYCTSGGKRWLFACFGVLRRELGERAGWFDGFYHYCGDCHLAMSIWKMGYQVVELTSGGYIKHYEAQSPYRNKNEMKPELKQKIKNDFRLFAKKWGDWDGAIDSPNEKIMIENNFKPLEDLEEE